jgi:LacI family repressor for deo operon, udp, cdd, tsx, nupC, and nupG
VIRIATIKEIARLAGVSIATVSRTLNDSPAVSEKTKQKVREVIAQTDYCPNVLGRNLRLNQTRTVLVILHTLSNTFFSKVIRGMEAAANQRGYKLLICMTNAKEESERNYLDMLSNRQVDGVIFAGSFINEAYILEMEKRFPMVTCTGFIERQSMPYVSIDDYQAAYDAICTLVKQGYQKIAMITVKNSLISTKLREKGYRDALIAHQISFDPTLIAYGDYGFTSGAAAITALLEQPQKPDAVFAISDNMAAGVLQTCLDRGIHIPDELGIIGFDNNNISRYMRPQLSTVGQPRAELGNTAMNLLIDQIEGNEILNKKITLPHEIILRGSTR